MLYSPSGAICGLHRAQRLKEENLFHIYPKRKTTHNNLVCHGAIIPHSPFQRSPKETFVNSIPLAYMENKFHIAIETEQIFP